MSTLLVGVQSDLKSQTLQERRWAAMGGDRAAIDGFIFFTSLDKLSGSNRHGSGMNVRKQRIRDCADEIRDCGDEEGLAP